MLDFLAPKLVPRLKVKFSYWHTYNLFKEKIDFKEVLKHCEEIF